MGLIPPQKATLAKYGLSMAEWQEMADKQEHKCFVCNKEPTKGRLVIDHFHLKGWKKLLPDQRKLFVRGLLCWTCNHYYLGRGITILKAENVVIYLKKFKERHLDNEAIK